MKEIEEFWYIIISLVSILPIIIFLKKEIKDRAGYVPFVIFMLIWLYNIFGFLRYALFKHYEFDEKFLRYMTEYGAEKLYGYGSSFATVFIFFVLMASYGLGVMSSKRKAIVINFTKYYTHKNSFFKINILISLIFLILSLYVIKDSIILMIAYAEDLRAYDIVSDGIENYSLHSMFFRLSCIAILFSLGISHSNIRLIITLSVMSIMFLSMVLLGQRNEIALLFLSAALIYINRKSNIKKMIVYIIIMLSLIRYIEIIRGESIEYVQKFDEQITVNLMMAILTFWKPILFGPETIFTHFSNLSFINLELINSPYQRITFWLSTLIPNYFGIPRGDTAYELMKEYLKLSDERGYNISIFSSSVYSFGVLGGLLFVSIFGYLCGKLTACFYQLSLENSWRGITYIVTLSVFASYLFIINRSGIDNMKPLVFYSIFTIIYGYIITKRIKI